MLKNKQKDQVNCFDVQMKQKAIESHREMVFKLQECMHFMWGQITESNLSFINIHFFSSFYMNKDWEVGNFLA